MDKIPALLLCLALPACGAGGIAIAASGGGGGGGGGSVPPRPPEASTSKPSDPLSSNLIAISYNLRDPQVKANDDRQGGEDDPRTRIVGQYRKEVTDARGLGTGAFETVWLPMTEADISTSDGVRGLPLGDRTFVWNASADLGAYAGSVKVRIVPEYELSAGFKRKFKLRETQFDVDNNEAGTLLGGDVVPFSDITTFPVDLRAGGGELFAASVGGGIVERVGPTGAIDRLVGLGVPGDLGDGGNPGVARLGALRGVDLDGFGNVFTVHDTKIRVTNRTGGTVDIGTLTLPAATIDRVQDENGLGLPLVNGRSPRIHPSGALLYSITSGSLTEIHAYNPEPIGGTTITLGGVSIAPGFDEIVVGGGVDDSDGNLGTATLVQLALGLAVGPDGEIYYVERDLARVRVFNPGVVSVTVGGVSVAAGTVVTVAGGNGSGDLGDGSAAINAQLNSPLGVAVAADRSLFVADTRNGAVRMVNLGVADKTFAGVTVLVGDIDTVMGGSAAGGGVGSLAPDTPLGVANAVAVDDDGNVLVADGEDVVFANGSDFTVTRLGKTVAAGRTEEVYDASTRGGIPLVAPRAVHLAAANFVLLTDRSTLRAYNVGAQPRFLGTVRVDRAKTAVVAGGAVPGFSGDGAEAVRAAFSSPSAIATDSENFVYVADSGNDRIRFVNLQDARAVLALPAVTVLGKTIASGDVDTVVGGATGPLPADGDGLLAGAAVLDNPMGVAFGTVNLDGGGASSLLLVADTGHHRIRVVNTLQTDVTILGTFVPAGTIQTLVGDGTPGFTADGAGPWQIDSPASVWVDNRGVIFFADSGNHRIRALNTAATTERRAGIDIPAGEIRTIAGTGVAGRGGDGGLAPDALVDSPQSIFVQTENATPVALYFSDPPQQVVRMINLSDDDRFLRVEADGSQEITPAGGIKTLAGGPNTFGFPNAPAYGGDGTDPSEIRFASPWGVVIMNGDVRFAGQTLSLPAHLFVGDRDNNRFRRVGARLVGANPADF